MGLTDCPLRVPSSLSLMGKRDQPPANGAGSGSGSDTIKADISILSTPTSTPVAAITTTTTTTTTTSMTTASMIPAVPAAFVSGRVEPDAFVALLMSTDPLHLLVLDLRSFLSYNQSHVKDAINVSVPAPLLKKKGFSLAVVEGSICRQGDKDKFKERQGLHVLLYDNTDELSQRNNILVSLFNSLQQENLVTSVGWLAGGFESFEKTHPQYCKLAGPIMSKLFKCVDMTNNVTKSLSSHNNSGPDEPVQILNYLFLAGEKVAGSRAILNKYNIKHIVNTAIECENSFPNDYSYLRLDLFDSCNQRCLFDTFDRAAAFICNARDLNQNVLVHCRAGQSRSATVVVAYLMKTLSWDLTRAYSYVQRRRPAMSPNLGFMGQLTQLDKELQQQRPKDHMVSPVKAIFAIHQQQQLPQPGSNFNLAERLARGSSLPMKLPPSPWSMCKSASAPPATERSYPSPFNLGNNSSSNNNSAPENSLTHPLPLSVTPIRASASPMPARDAAAALPTTSTTFNTSSSGGSGNVHASPQQSSSHFSMTMEDVPQAVVTANRTHSSDGNNCSTQSTNGGGNNHPANSFMFGVSPAKSPRIVSMQTTTNSAAGAAATPVYFSAPMAFAPSPSAMLRDTPLSSMSADFFFSAGANNITATSGAGGGGGGGGDNSAVSTPIGPKQTPTLVN